MKDEEHVEEPSHPPSTDFMPAPGDWDQCREGQRPGARTEKGVGLLHKWPLLALIAIIKFQRSAGFKKKRNVFIFPQL